MPKISFKPENKLESPSDFPKLRLDIKEKARVVCLGDPEFAFVHTLRAPRIVDGVAEKHIVERRDKSTFEDFKLDYIGQPQCLGNYEVLQERGVDPENCPICALASTDMAAPPQRRFAIHVFQYTVKNGSFDISLPFSGRIVVWRFTDTIFGKLVDIVNEWGPLQEVDLNLGPCTNKDFQKFEISNAKKTEWLQDDERKQYVVTALQENKASDLTAFCGRKTEARWIEHDLDTIREKWAIAKGEVTPNQQQAEELDTNLDGLLGSSTPAEATSPTPPVPTPVPPTPTPTPTPTPPPTPTPQAKEKGEKLSLDDLLADL